MLGLVYSSMRRLTLVACKEETIKWIKGQEGDVSNALVKYIDHDKTQKTSWSSTALCFNSSRLDFVLPLDPGGRAVPKTDKLILLVDFNARVSTDHLIWDSAIGKNGIGRCNSTGLLLLQYCAENGLLITNNSSASLLVTGHRGCIQALGTGDMATAAPWSYPTATETLRLGLASSTTSEPTDDPTPQMTTDEDGHLLQRRTNKHILSISQPVAA
ncbi:hypothetical protein ElyMa_003135900 [Elysia marginata]|uniref:Uncharacterized protein n=1 Tax=Elysia marginata TaxID=1093978 RepID=A0AAV4IUN6_9GAST|nr:hypothetical protein ElyMa_003135900 [Elysia marginata]